VLKNTNKKEFKMNFEPFGDRVLVKVPEVENTTKGGIILPDTASKDNPTEAEVIAIGGSTKKIEVGDTVVFSQYAGTKITLDGEEYLILEIYKDILGVMKK
jgi:chaperonin GroES